MATSTAGQRPTSRAELDLRDKFGAWVRARRTDEGLTQEMLCARIDPANPPPKNYVSRIERNDGGDFTIWGAMLVCRALGHTLSRALVESGVERPDLDSYLEDPTIESIETNVRLTRQVKDVAIAVIEKGYAIYRTESASHLRAVERRDVARRVGIPEELLSSWVRLSEEQRTRAVEFVMRSASENEETPAPPPGARGRRRRKG